MMKNKLRSLKDINHEKQKARKEIAVQEKTLQLHYKELKYKMSFSSLSAYTLGLIKKQLSHKMQGWFTNLLVSIFTRNRKASKQA